MAENFGAILAVSERHIQMNSACAIPDCHKPVLARGWCQTHYDRWRKQNPIGGTVHGEPERYLREVVLNYEGNECLPWPFSRSSNGYGQVWIDGEAHAIHRRVCEEVNGPPPTPDHEAAHKCGKGHESCVTKGHLVWKTHAENMLDVFEHGTSRRKLTDDEVREIFALKGRMLQYEIAEIYGVHKSTVSLIHRRKIWLWLLPPDA